jgi:acyl carrier protein
MIKTREQIRTYVTNNLLFNQSGYQLNDDTSFLDEGIVDSTGVVELVLFVEENFGLTVEDSEIVPDNFDSVNRLATYVLTKQKVY